MRRAEREALLLGLLHGPAELAPVSSSGHVAALPWLLGWEVAGWDGARRKELEVALHAGTAAALLLVLPPGRPRPALLAAAVAPPALAGLALERRIEQRLGTPATLAAGLLAGGAALVLADRAPATRAAPAATARDGLWLGLAQAAALIPGVSRNGATLAAARARRFARADASRLSWEVALPVLLGAGALKAWRVWAPAAGTVPDPRRSAANGGARGTVPVSVPETHRSAAERRALGTVPETHRSAVNRPVGGTVPLYLGAAGAFCSTLAVARAVGIERRGPLWPWAVWRAGLAAAILAVRQNRGR